MKILVLNGSPRPNGNTAALVSAFAEGAKENGHEVTVVPICQKKIAGCLACEYCHTKGEGKCIQQDDMRERKEIQYDIFSGFIAGLEEVRELPGHRDCARCLRPLFQCVEI